ncbi:MAG: ferritin-like domain-containing protein [Porphyrobacter sp.]|nr:ferritin-like domain-containing protein [Porphyrobacter sp.]
MTSVAEAIAGALSTGEPREKVKATRALARAWRRGDLAWDFATRMPERPASVPGLELLAPKHMAKRKKGGSQRAAIALWHSLAHIEFVAIDLALDMAGRFGGEMDREFVGDFIAVASDEAMHFILIERKLRTLGSSYGDLPAHDGLWQAAHETRHDVAARLAVVPMVLEARGLDVTPAMRERLLEQGDSHGARILQRILDDEIQHVAAGARHFKTHCQACGNSPESHWKSLVNRYFRGSLKPPFNDSARLAAGLPRDFYAGVA